MPKTQPLKKLALSSLVVFGFATYVLHERSDNTQNVVVTSGKGFRQHADVGEAGQNSGSAANVFPPPTRLTATLSAVSSTSTNIQPLVSLTPAANIAYQDGTFTGSITDAVYGNVQVKTTIQNGKIMDVQFLDYPHDRHTSQEINAQAMPSLKQEVIQAQNAQVDFITGATLTSQAFVQSLQSALDKAKKQP